MPINIIQGNKMEFCIQASNPKTQDIVNSDDESLSDAIESAFLLNTENAILTWKYITWILGVNMTRLVPSLREPHIFLPAY